MERRIAPSEATEKQRSLNYDVMRIFAAVMVVVLHTSSVRWHLTPVDTFAWSMMNVYDSMVRSAVPLFLMLTGAFMLTKDVDIKRLYTKKIAPLCLIWFVWSVFYAIDVVGFDSIRYDGLDGFISMVIEGHFHLWFIPTLIAIYMLLPLLRRVVTCHDGRYLGYFLTGFLCFGIMGMTLVSLIDSRLASDLLDIVPVGLFVYTGYVLLGYYLANVYERRPRSSLLVALFGVSVVICAAFAQIESIASGEPSSKLYGYFSATTLVEAVCVFLFFKGITVSCSDKTGRLIVGLSKLTFGVYLIHPFIIEQLSDKLAFDVMSYNAALSIPVNALIVVCISACLTALFGRVPVIRRLWMF